MTVEVVAAVPGGRWVPAAEDDHVIDGTTWYPLAPEDLEAARDILHRVDAREGAVSLDAYPEVYRSAPDIPIVDEVPAWSVAHTELPSNLLMVPLYPYQRIGYEWLTARARAGFGAILADEMGLGKTIQAIATMAHLSREQGRPNLVVSPLTVTANWLRELQRFAPSLRTYRHWGPDRIRRPVLFDEVDVAVTNYETAVSDSGMLGRVLWGAVVLDEAQAIKNPDTQRRAALQRLHATTRIAMTGTPLENRTLDLWSLADYVAPGHLGSRASFEARLSEDPDGLRRASQAILIRREVASVAADLPPKVVSDVPLEMFVAEAAAYVRLLDDLERGRTNVLAAFTTLRQFSGHPHLLDKLTDRSPEDACVKFARLAELLEELRDQGEKVIVFAAFHGLIDLISDFATRRLSLRAWSLDGRTDPSLRQTNVDEFTHHRGAAVMVLNPTAGGVGLNIQAATHVVHYTLEWNPAREDQATARVWRRGQDSTVFVSRLFYPESVDGAILQKLREKRELASQVVRPRDSDEAEIADLLKLALQRRPTRTSDDER